MTRDAATSFVEQANRKEAANASRRAKRQKTSPRWSLVVGAFCLAVCVYWSIRADWSLAAIWAVATIANFAAYFRERAKKGGMR